MTKLHIVVRSITEDRGVGGLERSAYLHLKAMLSLGIQIDLYSPQTLKGADGLTCLEVPWPRSAGKVGMGVAYWRWCKRVADLLGSRIEPRQILHLHGASAGVLRFLPRSEAKQAVVVIHGMEEFSNDGLVRESNRYFIRKLAVSGTDTANTVVATDTALVPAVKRNFPNMAGRLTVIPNAVDVAALRELSHVDTDPPGKEPAYVSVVSVGRLVRNKGFDLAVDALRTLNDRGNSRPVCWQLFGSGPEADAISRASRDMSGVGFKLIQQATDAHVQRALASADFLLVPSRYEGSSLVTLEAMAQGAVVVATPVGGIPDKITDGVNGYLAENVSAASLADALQRAMASSGEHVRSAALRTVRENWDISQLAFSYARLYEDSRFD